MTKTFHFISGLPRSGSTLLANILYQNPCFHASSTSGAIEIILGIRNSWDDVDELKASHDLEAKKSVMASILPAFYAKIDRPVVFDKSRGWLAHIGLLEDLLGRKVKILTTVRDIRDILASFEKLWRRDSKIVQLHQEKENFVDFQTMQGRAEVWLSPNQAVGMTYRRLVDALKRGFGDRIHLVDFDDLTSDPQGTMTKIYSFLGEPEFKHSFDKIDQVTREDDATYGFTDLHTIRTSVEAMKPQWPSILGKEFERYGQMNFWKN